MVEAFFIAPILGEESDHLLAASDEYMASLYPPESNHLVSSESLRSGDALFLGAFVPASGLRETGEAEMPSETHNGAQAQLGARNHTEEIAKGRCVGCVAARFERAAGYAEIKRLFIERDYRGRGIAKALMLAIEAGIRAERIDCARLEMGISQPEANALYRSMGYRDIPPFGNYLLDPLSQFLEKRPLDQ